MLLDVNVMTYCIVPLALLSNRLIQVLLAPVAEALDGLGDTTQRAVDLFGIHVLCVILHHATRHTERNTHEICMTCLATMLCALALLLTYRLVVRKGKVGCK